MKDFVEQELVTLRLGTMPKIKRRAGDYRLAWSSVGEGLRLRLVLSK